MGEGNGRGKGGAPASRSQRMEIESNPDKSFGVASRQAMVTATSEESPGRPFVVSSDEGRKISQVLDERSSD